MLATEGVHHSWHHLCIIAYSSGVSVAPRMLALLLLLRCRCWRGAFAKTTVEIV